MKMMFMVIIWMYTANGIIRMNAHRCFHTALEADTWETEALKAPMPYGGGGETINLDRNSTYRFFCEPCEDY